MCCPHYRSSPSNKTTPVTSSSLPSPSLALQTKLSQSPEGTQQSLRIPCDDQWVLERSWQPITCLCVASRLALRFSRVPVSYIPARRAVSYFEWSTGSSLPWLWYICTMFTQGKSAGLCFHALSNVQKSPTSFNTIFFYPQFLHYTETFPLKVFPDSALRSVEKIHEEP